MKFVKIISISLLFSIGFLSSVSAGYIDELLEFDAGVEAFEINTVAIDTLTFENQAVSAKFGEFKKIVAELKSAIIIAYANEELSYYQTQGLITNLNNFIYSTNKFFYYISEKEKNPSSKELTNAILRNYKLSRSYFKKLKDIYNK